jgi:hypothetical protein
MSEREKKLGAKVDVGEPARAPVLHVGALRLDTTGTVGTSGTQGSRRVFNAF